MRHLLTLLLIAGCVQMPVAGQVVPGTTFRLVSIDDVAFAAPATIRFDGTDGFAGTAPCNSYSGQFVGPLPQFAAARFTATEMACDDLPAEMAFFAALTQMTRVEVTAATLILVNDAGRRMVFVQP